METNRAIVMKQHILLLFIVTGECRRISSKCVCQEISFLCTKQVKGSGSEIADAQQIMKEI